jgi:hypothetical protein
MVSGCSNVIETGVPRFIDHAHSALAELFQHGEWAKLVQVHIGFIMLRGCGQS